MLVQPDITSLARVLADESRSAMLFALAGGEAYTASELARVARVSNATASSHLRKLLDVGFVRLDSVGRYRYYQLTPAAAAVLEAFARSAPRKQPRSPIEQHGTDALVAARTCYDHLAGRLGVAIAHALEERGYLVHRGSNYRVTPAGEAFLRQAAVEVKATSSRRPFVRSCLDWSERRPHVAGTLGAALAAHALQRGWISRVRGTRAVRVTPAGRRAFIQLFGVHPEEL